MQQQRGFTLIELIVGIVFFAVLVLMAAPILFGSTTNANVSWGVNGVTESRCIEGYKFILDHKGNARQILDEFGKGVRCQNGGM
jgi:prepilin-type N-terminal cleavage/methylation domain-containing protein